MAFEETYIAGLRVISPVEVNMLRCNSAKSDAKHVTHGVPQGSILGPLLFNTYMNDFYRSSDLLFSILFADDTSVFIEGTHFYDITPNFKSRN